MLKAVYGQAVKVRLGQAAARPTHARASLCGRRSGPCMEGYGKLAANKDSELIPDQAQGVDEVPGRRLSASVVATQKMLGALKGIQSA